MSSAEICKEQNLEENTIDKRKCPQPREEDMVEIADLVTEEPMVTDLPSTPVTTGKVTPVQPKTKAKRKRKIDIEQLSVPGPRGTRLSKRQVPENPPPLSPSTK